MNKLYTLLILLLLTGCNASLKSSSELPVSQASPAPVEAPAMLEMIYPAAPIASSRMESRDGEPSCQGDCNYQYERAVEKATPKSTKADKQVKQQLDIPTRIDFEVPRSTNISNTITAKLTVIPVELISTTPLKANSKSTNVTVSNLVEAILESPDGAFNITPAGPRQQVILRGEKTVWEWEVTPKSAGVHKLKVTATSIVQLNGKEKPVRVEAISYEVTVEITPWQMLVVWFKEYWQWLATVIVIPLIVYGWKAYKKKENRNGNRIKSRT